MGSKEIFDVLLWAPDTLAREILAPDHELYAYREGNGV